MKSRFFIIIIIVLSISVLAVYGQDAVPNDSTSPRGFNWIILLYVAIVSLAGIVLLLLAYFIWELITPYSVKIQLLEQKNTAVAIVAASFVIGMAIVIAAALLAFR